jgi:carboxypeptidase C (cathepsin A)
MKIALIVRFTLAICLAGAIGTAAAQDTGRSPPGRAEHREPGQGILRLLPADAITEHSIDTAQGKLVYMATAGTLAFYDQSGNQSASVFYTAYVAKDAPNKGANRPLTFVFNGGPGAASAFLHLGLVGPRILTFGLDGHEAARSELHDNPETWLAFTDLVVIDPIGTGWSRAAKADDAKHFWNVRSDADAMAKAIALYVTHNNRAAAPKY